MDRAFLVAVVAIAIIAALGCASNAQQPQVPGLSDIIPVIEQQRNQALSNHAVSQARVSELTRENDALKAALAARDAKVAELLKALADTPPQIPPAE